VSNYHDLQYALSNWFSSALCYLASTEPPLRTKRSLTVDEYGNLQARVGGGYEPYIWLWVQQQRIPLVRLLETHSLERAVLDFWMTFHKPEDNGEIAPWNQAGDFDFFGRFVAPLLCEYLYACQLQQPSRESIESMTNQISEYLRQPVMHFTPSTVMLEGVFSDTDFELEPGVSFRATDALEQKRYYFGEDPNMPDSDMSPSHFHRGFAPNHVLSISVDHFPKATEIAETFVLACRLLGIETAGYKYIDQRPNNPVRMSGYSQAGPLYSESMSGNPQELKEEHRVTLIKYWQRYRHIYGDKELRIVLTRYSRSFGRPSFEDQIVDLCVALESVFAAESASGEISYRVSLRASRLLVKDPASREKIFSEIKSAYSLRSKVVHGSSDMKPKDWEKLISSISYARDIVRQVLLKMAEEGWRPDYPKMDFADTH
jgi:hypothetical protein